MPPPAPASLLAGLVARIRCRKAAVPELAGQPWQVGGLPRASGGRAAAAGAAARGCAEGLPVRCCYFGLCPPPPLYTKSCARSSAQLPKGRLVGFFFHTAGEHCVGVGKVSEEQVLGARGLPWSSSPACPQNTLLARPLAALAEAGIRGRSDSGS